MEVDALGNKAYCSLCFRQKLDSIAPRTVRTALTGDGYEAGGWCSRVAEGHNRHRAVDGLEADAGSFVWVAAGLIRLHRLRPNHRCAALAAFLAALWPLNVHVCVGLWQRHMQPAKKYLVSPLPLFLTCLHCLLVEI